MIDAGLDHVGGHWLRNIIVFVAVTATEVAATRDDQLPQKRTLDVE
jgi:hypothetical protein